MTRGTHMQAAARPHVMGGVALAGASLIAVTPVTSLPDLPHVTNAAVRLTSGASDLLDLGSLSGLTDLGNLGNLGGLFDSGSLLNIPYNLFADVANIPYYESLALQEYAYALGPAGATGGVAGWIPPGADVTNGGVHIVDGLPYYALGGTGSWYGESIGNTWGWDDGNYPQLDALLHVALPLSFTQNDIVNPLQTFAQAEFIDGAHIGCEFECANPLGYLGGWAHGQTSLESLLSGFHYPPELTDTVGGNGGPLGDIINIANPQVTVPTPVGDLTGTGTIWSGASDQLNPLQSLEGIASSLTASPADNPIQFPNIGDVFSNGLKLFEDNMRDFNPFQEGSFLWWGAAKDYSIPSVLGGTLQDFTGIPNQWGLANLGAEPVSGYTSTPLSLPEGYLHGLEYFLTGDGGLAGNGLLGYLNPDTYLQALNTDIGTLTNPNNLLASLPLVGFLGLGNNVPGAIAPGSFLGTFAPSSFPGPFDASLFSGLLDTHALLGGALDPSTLLGNTFDPAALLSTFDPSSLLGSTFDPSALLASLDPSTLAGDLSSLLPGAAGTIPDLGLNLLTSLF
jgi:hypothetical protein